MDLSIIIVNWNTKDLLLKCLEAVYENANGVNLEVWVVDNASTDGSVEAVKDQYRVVNLLCNKQNLGFACANNLALRNMGGRYALLLNTDAFVTEGAVMALYTFMEAHPESGMACGQLLDMDGSKQNSIANFPTLSSLFLNETLMRVMFPNRFPSKMQTYKFPIEIESGIGACLMVRKEAMDAVGFLDESYFFFLEETDWAFRMRQEGWKIFFVPDVQIFHGQGQSVGDGVDARILYYQSRYLYFKKWHPGAFRLFYTLVFARLMINIGLSLAGILLTVGIHRGLRKKMKVYIQLLVWHLKGCP